MKLAEIVEWGMWGAVIIGVAFLVVPIFKRALPEELDPAITRDDVRADYDDV